MSKKLPSNTNEKGIVGNPAEPTLEPGGRPAAADWVAGTPVAGVVEALDEEEDELDDEDELGEDEEDEPCDEASAAACEAAGATAGPDVPDVLSLIERKSIWEPVETWSS